MTVCRLALVLIMLCAPASLAGRKAVTPPAKPIKTKALKALVKAAESCPALNRARCEALATIVGHKEAAAPGLMALLRSKKASYRTIAATSLGSIGYGPAGKAVLPLLKDPEVSVQHAAIIATGRLAPEGAVRALSRIVGSEDLNLRVLATTALGLTGKAAAVTTLMRLLENNHPKVQTNAVRALGAIGNTRATMTLATLLADPVTRSPVRLAAAEALGRIGDPEAVPILLQATGEREAQIRKAAVVSLGWLADARAVSALTLLIKEPELTEVAMKAIGQIGHVDGLASLLRIIKEPGTDPIRLKQAFWAAGEIKSESTVAAMKTYLVAEDKQIVRWACDALGRVRLPSAIQSLIDTLHHDDRDTKEMAAWALQQLTGVNLGTDISRWEEWYYARKKAE